MAKSYKKSAEERSIFLSPVETNGEKGKKGERVNTSPLREARLIPIERIEPDPNQPRKRFVRETLKSLADSIKEVGGIIDPLTVEYDEEEDCFRIISGERRYRAAKLAGLEKLPCIIKEIDDKRRFLLQLIANLQREDITPLEESAAVKFLIEKFSYSQTEVAKLLNKSKSYISQILGLKRLTESARKIVQTSELSKEIQIQASREKEPGKQAEILKKACEKGKTVRQIRAEGKMAALSEAEDASIGPCALGKRNEIVAKDKKFRKWAWKPEDGRFVVIIRFRQEQSENKKIPIVKAALEEVHRSVRDLPHGKGISTI